MINTWNNPLNNYFTQIMLNNQIQRNALVNCDWFFQVLQKTIAYKLKNYLRYDYGKTKAITITERFLIKTPTLTPNKDPYK